MFKAKGAYDEEHKGVAIAVSRCIAVGMRSTEDSWEYRQLFLDHPDMPGVRVEKFDVAQPLNRVAQFVKRKGEECLNIDMVVTARNDYGATYRYNVSYQPHTTISAKTAEIYVTYTHPGNFGAIDTDFVFLADFHPAANNKTRVELYYAWSSPIAKAVKAWASGNDIGCPNLAS